MKKYSKILALVVASFFTVTSFALAGNVIGVTGTLAKIEASGTETEGTAADTSDRSKSVDNTAGYGSIYLEHIRDNGIAIGLEYVPFSADVSDQVHSRTDTSQAGSGEGRSGTTVNTAAAEIENYRTVYVELPRGAAYLRLGFSQVDVNTQEAQITNGGTYGDATLDGYNIGLGLKTETDNGLQVKFNVQYTDFEDLDLSSSTNNSINADLDLTTVNLSVGRSF